MPWLWAVLVMCVVALYVAAYFYGGVVVEDPIVGKLRIFYTRLETRLFFPMAWIEAKITGKPVEIAEYIFSQKRKDFGVHPCYRVRP